MQSKINLLKVHSSSIFENLHIKMHAKFMIGHRKYGLDNFHQPFLWITYEGKWVITKSCLQIFKEERPWVIGLYLSLLCLVEISACYHQEQQLSKEHPWAFLSKKSHPIQWAVNIHLKNLVIMQKRKHNFLRMMVCSQLHTWQCFLDCVWKLFHTMKESYEVILQNLQEM